VEIPEQFQPHPDQIPRTLTTPEEIERWKLCFAVGRLITRRDDLQFVGELYDSDIPTGNMAEKVNGADT
jgi:hypothetical protein